MKEKVMTEPSDTSPDAEQEIIPDAPVDPVQAAKDARAERHPDSDDNDQAEATAGDVQTDDQSDDDQDDEQDQGGAGSQ
jgi:hypothetical protein